MACAPSGATPFPTTDPNAINTIIAQTANAALTMTAANAPPTTTSTPTPHNTEPPSPTVTVTFVFILPGLGPTGTATVEEISSGNSNSDYACTLFSTEPLNGTTIAPRADFVATWGVKNIGKKGWFRATMDYKYVSGDKLHEVASYDLPKGVDPGKNVFLTVDMATFKDSGTYTTKWALVEDDHFFCPMTITINVK